MSSKWNAADSTLLCAAFIFLAALGFQLIHPSSVVADCVLFVAEAALVGGVADWFAVTALFKKPLGFPFHTAILPNRRQDFIDASVSMVKNEFFSRKSIFKKVSQFHLLPHLIEYLKRPDIRRNAIELIFSEIASFVHKLDKESVSKKFANEIRRTLRDVPSNILIHELSQWLKKSGKDKVIFSKIVSSLRDVAATNETRVKIQHVLESYANEHTQASTSFSMLMTNLAQALDLVNFSEAALLMQRHLLVFLDELAIDSKLQRDVLEHCRTIFSEIVDSVEFRDMLYRLQLDSVNAVPFETIIQDAITSIDSQLSKINVKNLVDSNNAYTLPAIIAHFLFTEYDRLLSMLETDSAFKSSVEKFIFDLTARSALAAQPLFANIANSALSKMSDEQLNALVYSKAEPDFIWIRLNGSIVGSVIGLILFIIMQFVPL